MLACGEPIALIGVDGRAGESWMYAFAVFCGNETG